MRTIFLVAALALALGLSACASQTNSSADLPPLEDTGAKSQDTTDYYDDFSDILLPIDLKRVPAESYVFESSQFKTGYLVYEGAIEFNSLISYFLNNMAKDGWKAQSTLRAEKSTLVFEKPNKSALIQVANGSFKTRVSIIAVEVKGTPSLGSISESETVIIDSKSGGAMIQEQEILN